MATEFSNLQEYFRKRKQIDGIETNGHQSCPKTNEQIPKTAKKSQCEILGIITNKPKYKQYACIASRKSTFNNWPGNIKIPTIDKLSEAGFAYTGVSDSVRCFYCGIVLNNWSTGACLWKQHTLASPTCSHVIQCKGQEYVNFVLTQKDQNSEEDIYNNDGIVDTIQLAIYRNEDAVSVARMFCSNEDLIHLAIKSLLKHNKLRIFSAVDLVKAVEEIEETRELEAESEVSDSEMDDDIKEINRQLKEPVTCKICFDAIACIITLPCGHLACCSQCIPALSKCAICRAQIKGTVRAQMVA